MCSYGSNDSAGQHPRPSWGRRLLVVLIVVGMPATVDAAVSLGFEVTACVVAGGTVRECAGGEDPVPAPVLPDDDADDDAEGGGAAVVA